MAEGNKKRFDTNSNSYIIIYSTILVVVVAFLLALVFQVFKSRQDANEALDKKKQILNSLNIRNLSDEEANKAYHDIVLGDKVIDANAKVISNGEQGGVKDGFKLTGDDFKKGKLALFDCNVNGKKVYVIPVYGMGLWGPINGYIAVNDDKSTIYGVYFNHASETAGLGAEIKDNANWQALFKNKHIFANDRNTVALSISKKIDPEKQANQVDAVTGATLTMNGVTEMLHEGLGAYIKFFNDKK